MIGLGVGIDYALFIVTRYREHIAAGDEPEDATVHAINTAGRAVVFAGTIVIISMLGMLLMGVSFIRGLGIGAALAVFTTLIASLTLLPALLGFARRRIDFTTWYAVIGIVVLNVGLFGFALGRQAVLPIGVAVGVAIAVIAGRFVPAAAARQAPIHKPPTPTTTCGTAGAARVQRHPWTGVIAGVVILLVLAAPMLSMRLGFSDNGNLPKDQTARQAYDLLAEAFGPGFNGPLVLVAELPAGTTPESLQPATDLAGRRPTAWPSPQPGPDRARPATSPSGGSCPTSGPQDAGDHRPGRPAPRRRASRQTRPADPGRRQHRDLRRLLQLPVRAGSRSSWARCWCSASSC